ncbi:hypothetical protein AX16_003454 [Volvariella volvacea WC 439]|nr:hypothetical protein AX16_003454 [Volvariella volvacea WC 439]
MLALVHPFNPPADVTHRSSPASSQTTSTAASATATASSRQRPSQQQPQLAFRRPSSSSRPSSSQSGAASRSASAPSHHGQRHPSLPLLSQPQPTHPLHHSQSLVYPHHVNQESQQLPSQSPPKQAATASASDATQSAAGPGPNHHPASSSQEPRSTTPTQSTQPTTAGTENHHQSFDIHSYPSADLLKLLAALLTDIASANDKLDANANSTHPSASSSSSTSTPTDSSTYLHSLTLPTSSTSAHHDTPIWRSLTSASRAAVSTPSSTLTFHARHVPTITLEAYFLRILKYCPTTNEVFLSLLVYFERMSKLSTEATGRTFVIDSYNIHRLVIAGVTVASKFFSDVFYTNSRYAKVGGLPLAELNQLELQFLLLNDFRLVISSSEMQRYADQLVLYSQSKNPPIVPSLPPPLPPSPQPPSPSPSSQPSLAVQLPADPKTAASFVSPTTPTNPNASAHQASSSSLSSSSALYHQRSESYDAHRPAASRPTAASVAAPMHAMGAIDAYGGRLAGESEVAKYHQHQHQHQHHGQYDRGPAYPYERSCGAGDAGPSSGSRTGHHYPAYAHYGENGADTDAETEADTTTTDGGETTDDEPTIRASGRHGQRGGSGESDTTSLCDSVYSIETASSSFESSGEMEVEVEEDRAGGMEDDGLGRERGGDRTPERDRLRPRRDGGEGSGERTPERRPPRRGSGRDDADRDAKMLSP